LLVIVTLLQAGAKRPRSFDDDEDEDDDEESYTPPKSKRATRGKKVCLTLIN